MRHGDETPAGHPATAASAPAPAVERARPGGLLLRRREFLTALGATVAASVLPGAAGCGDRDASAARFLDDGELATLTALVDRVLPPDGDPGAAALGAADFVDRLLAAF